MILESNIRFKYTFSHCDSYKELYSSLDNLKELFKEFQSLGVLKEDSGQQDDYHNFYIDTDDQEKIKRLKDLGFEEDN